MAVTVSIFSTPSPLPLVNLKHLKASHKSASISHRRQLSVLAMTSISLPINVDYLETEFSGHGVSFQGVGDSCAVKMVMENGSVATLMLPSGLVTSYKPIMWHGATFEVLHTTVSEGEAGEAVVRGGASMDFKIHADGCSSIPWSSNHWSLQSVRGSPENSIQVELLSLSPHSMVEAKFLVTLDQDSISSELIVANTKSSSAIEMSGSFISHLKVSTPDATYAVGLQGSNYHSKKPISSEFSIIPPSLWTPNEKEEEEGSSTEESEGEEDDDYAHMTEKMSRIYTSAPRQFTIIDRGRRNSVVIRRSGLEEVYMYSPGSEHDWYGNYAYVCVGPSAKLRPLVVAPGGIWRGSQCIHNPNL
ncbi:protein NDH-DEPENDENT CYCLIC ELECTRON FLOW 5-like [Zingiber officinale]|uniref:NDH-dependent cyclic electron flow 5 n=1 Tax=Zingiber officinale TaxID=94328 RepID=A0A8J5GBP4_ZINOF|nr:protein NDH-DEPENDENT CYCLIC ELECTRON FLOW 5-like [Zingiber officinale]KAG6505098.1 hypothetical protein ZIOFF_037446 [Zingiber officinale]